jgi:hypothetical protein
MKINLIRLGLNELFGGVQVCRRSEPEIQASMFYSSSIAEIHERQSSKRAAAISATPTMTTPFNLRLIQFSTAKSGKSRCGGHCLIAQ